MFGISAFSQSPFSSLGGSIKFGIGDINGNAIATIDATRIRTFTGTISADGSVVINGIRIQQSPASISANATVDSSAIRYRTSSGDISGIARVVSDGLSWAYASGTMFSNVSVTLDATRVRTSTGSVTATGSAQGLGGTILEAFPTIEGNAIVNALGNAIWYRNAGVSANGDISVSGVVLGEEWSDSTAGTETWSTVSPENEIWVEDTPESNTWLRKG
jgi:hypothetical protein